MSKVRQYGVRVYLTVLGGLLMALGQMPESFAQDRPAIVRPDKSKASKNSKKEDSSKTPAAGDPDKGGEETAEMGPSAHIGKILPQGRTLKGVKLPSYTGDRLSSLMTAISMKRLDESHFGMNEMVITMYARPGESETLITTERGMYDLVKEEITSDTRTLIEQDGVFDLEGDAMVFDANTQKGRMTGNVKMLLYQARENLMKKNGSTDQGAEKKEDGK